MPFYRFDSHAYHMDPLSIASIHVPITWIFPPSLRFTRLSHRSSLHRSNLCPYHMNPPSITSIPLPPKTKKTASPSQGLAVQSFSYAHLFQAMILRLRKGLLK